MIFPTSVLNVADNSGIKYVKCLKVIRTISAIGKKQKARIGDVLLLAVRVTKPLDKIKKGHILRGLIIRTKFATKRIYGWLKFYKNSVVVLNLKNEPIGNRIFGVIQREALEQNFVKISAIRIIEV